MPKDSRSIDKLLWLVEIHAQENNRAKLFHDACASSERQAVLSERKFMQSLEFTQSPLAVLTLIAAPAILTNATSTLASSTLNRMFRTRDRMNELFAKSETGNLPEAEVPFLLEQVDRVEKQAVLLLRALHSIYIALGAFAAATLITLLAEGLAPLWGALWFRAMAGFGFVLGLVGVGGLVSGSVKLSKATRMSLDNIRAEAELIREHQAKRNTGAANRAGIIQSKARAKGRWYNSIFRGRIANAPPVPRRKPSSEVDSL